MQPTREFVLEDIDPDVLHALLAFVQGRSQHGLVARVLLAHFPGFPHLEEGGGPVELIADGQGHAPKLVVSDVRKPLGLDAVLGRQEELFICQQIAQEGFLLGAAEGKGLFKYAFTEGIFHHWDLP
jgi:hypothetical protein